MSYNIAQNTINKEEHQERGKSNNSNKRERGEKKERKIHTYNRNTKDLCLATVSVRPEQHK